LIYRSRRKRKGRSRGKHGSKKQAAESTNGRESSPSPALNNLTAQEDDHSNGNAPLLPQSSSLSSSTSSISDEVNGKEDMKVEGKHNMTVGFYLFYNRHIYFAEDESQHVDENPPLSPSPLPVTSASESFDWQAAFGFKTESLTNGWFFNYKSARGVIIMSKLNSRF